MRMFRDKSQDCFRLCVGVTNKTLTKDLGFDHLRGMTNEEKNTIMGFLIYNIAGIHNAKVARAVVGYYSSKFSDDKRHLIENEIQQYYSVARTISESNMRRSETPLYATIDAWVDYIIKELNWPVMETLKEDMKDMFFNFYVSIKTL